MRKFARANFGLLRATIARYNGPVLHLGHAAPPAARGLTALTFTEDRKPGDREFFNRALLLGTASSTAFITLNTVGRPLHAEAAAAPSRFSTLESIPKDKMKVTLYQYDVCPFCNKVRAYLDYHKIPYTVVEVEPMGKKELAQFSKEYRKVPIAIVNDVQVNGSNDIIAAVQASVYGEDSNSPETIQEEDAAWLQWVDDHLIHLISPNIYRTPTESLQAFDYIADHAKFSSWQKFSVRYTGAAAMYFVGKKIKKKYNIDEPRAAMYEAINKWTDAVERHGGFLGGKGKPGTADLAVYGVLRAIMNFDTFQDIKEHCAAFEPWFERTRQAVGEPSIVSRL